MEVYLVYRMRIEQLQQVIEVCQEESLKNYAARRVIGLTLVIIDNLAIGKV